MLCTILTAGHRHDFLVSSRWRPIISMINCRQSVRKHFFQLYYITEKPQDKTNKGTVYIETRCIDGFKSIKILRKYH